MSRFRERREGFEGRGEGRKESEGGERQRREKKMNGETLSLLPNPIKSGQITLEWGEWRKTGIICR